MPPQTYSSFNDMAEQIGMSDICWHFIPVMLAMLPGRKEKKLHRIF
jgi:hypothetical protein